MNRKAKIAGTVLLACCAATASLARAQHGSEAQNDAVASQPVSEALTAGAEAKREGKLAEAEENFKKVLELSQRGSEQYAAAVEELTFHLPFLRAERYVSTEQWLRAERTLESLLQEHQHDVRKSEQLAQLVAVLRESARGAGEARQPGRTAIRYIEGKMGEFRDENGRYPGGYKELNTVLPADRFPLNDYDIVHYVGNRSAYGMTLRSKQNPDNVLTVQQTGPVE